MGSIFDDRWTLLLGATRLNASRAKSYQKRETTVGSKLQRSEICDWFIFSHALSTNGKVQTQPNIGDQTNTAGGLWGAYVIRVAHFCKDQTCRIVKESEL